jgi:hypothetical protein
VDEVYGNAYTVARALQLSLYGVCGFEYEFRAGGADVAHGLPRANCGHNYILLWLQLLSQHVEVHMEGEM